jgi:hypothetical protein
MEPPYIVRLMFEWGGGCLWGGNEAAAKAFDVGPIEDHLPLSPGTRQQLRKLSLWHDSALHWEYPPDPSPWSREERERFERAAAEMLTVLQIELGPRFEVVYVAL